MTRGGFDYAAAKSELDKIERRLILKKTSRVADFDYRGMIRISLNGDVIGSVPVYEGKRLAKYD
ncbi:hypothetical protein D3C81_962170 [compost metagenome]